MVNIYLILNKSLAKVSAESRAILLHKHSELIESLGPSSARYVYSMGELIQAEVFLSEGELAKGWQLFAAAVRRFPFLPLRRYLAVMRHLAEALLSPARS